MTTTAVDAPLLRIALRATETTGMRQDSYVMIDKLTTVRRSSIQTRIGRIPTVQFVAVERALMVFLGLAD